MQPRYIFLDTEFTDHSNSELLSLGMVTLEGDELYVELSGASGDRLTQDVLARGALNPFVRDHVLPLFGRSTGAACAAADVGLRVALWVSELDQQARAQEDGTLPTYYVCYDWATDFNLLEAALVESGHWPALSKRLMPGYLGILNTDPTAEIARETAYAALAPRGLVRHHALADAWALARAYDSQGR